MMLGLLPSYPSVTMIAAAPDGAPPQRVTKNQKTPCPLCLGEALRRGSFEERTIFMVRVWTESIHIFLSIAENPVNPFFIPFRT